MVADNISESDYSMQGEGPPSGVNSMSPPLGVEQMMSVPQHYPSLFCSRKQREFTPNSKKDDTYWDRRKRNNAAAKRSREKRRLNDMLLEKRVVQLARENHILRAQVTSVFKSYGIRAETLIDMDQVLATLPTEDQLLQTAGVSIRSVPSPPPLAPSISMTIGMSPQHTGNSEHPGSRFDDIYGHQHFPRRSSIDLNPQQLQQQQRPGIMSSSNSSGGRSSTSSPKSISTLSSGQEHGSPVSSHHGSLSGSSVVSRQLPQKPSLPPAQQIAVDFSKRECSATDGATVDSDDRDSVSAPKRSYPMAWDHDSRIASSSSSCESINGDDPINLTCNSRSRSSSENEDEILHHMPHKMRYKYIQQQECQGNDGEKEEY